MKRYSVLPEPVCIPFVSLNYPSCRRVLISVRLGNGMKGLTSNLQDCMTCKWAPAR